MLCINYYMGFNGCRDWVARAFFGERVSSPIDFFPTSEYATGYNEVSVARSMPDLDDRRKRVASRSFPEVGADNIAPCGLISLP